ncbi:thioredoxin [Sphingomonas changnyeongensis]|uniref:Thioredoxin n=1 Tax=Sphingomonas changnyeongensis TaxID=2698679 RepID=A0A7Z2NY41_9SPHN|nr:thioredoxin [Sphingomonas changnyeongensis]
MATKEISDASFEADVLKADKPVLVDFWAEWCGPCKQIGPALEELSDELGEKVTIAKLNIDDHPDAPVKYGVRGIPTMILFKNGVAAATKVGAAPRARSRAGWKASCKAERRFSAPYGAGAAPGVVCSGRTAPARSPTRPPNGRLRYGRPGGGAGRCRPCAVRRSTNNSPRAVRRAANTPAPQTPPQNLSRDQLR